MAKMLDDFQFSSGRKTKYPWNTWLNGKIWQIKQGEDFDCSVTSMYSVLVQTAKRKGLKYKINCTSDSLIFKVTPTDNNNTNNTYTIAKNNKE